jgi:hypothetical protein
MSGELNGLSAWGLMSLHESYLVHRGFRYLKVAIGLSVLALILYWGEQPLGPRNGGTWAGYGLGTLGLGLIVWLSWFGIRKRRYESGAGRLKGWLSAHVYLGLALLLIGTLHTGFQFAWNLHTLAYALMVLVILSGLFGVLAYARIPALMTANRGGRTLSDLLRELAEMDRRARELGMAAGDALALAVRSSQEQTQIGGSAWVQLRGGSGGCSTLRAIATIESLAAGIDASHAEQVAGLLTLLRRRADLLARIRTDIRHKALMEIWLFVHVPLTVGLLAALTAHVISVFFYW